MIFHRSPLKRSRFKYSTCISILPPGHVDAFNSTVIFYLLFPHLSAQIVFFNGQTQTEIPQELENNSIHTAAILLFFPLCASPSIPSSSTDTVAAPPPVKNCNRCIASFESPLASKSLLPCLSDFLALRLGGWQNINCRTLTFGAGTGMGTYVASIEFVYTYEVRSVHIQILATG